MLGIVIALLVVAWKLEAVADAIRKLQVAPGRAIPTPGGSWVGYTDDLNSWALEQRQEAYTASSGNVLAPGEEPPVVPS